MLPTLTVDADRWIHSCGSAGTALTPVRRCRPWTSAGIGRISANTTLAACTAGPGGKFFLYFRTQQMGHTPIITNISGGTVAICLSVLLGQPNHGTCRPEH